LRTVLATDLGIWPAMQDLHKVSDLMVISKAFKQSLSNYILLYDQIYIPTGNLQILPVLRIILGEDVFDELVKNNVLVFVRYDKWFSYGGNGTGLNFFSVGNKDMKPDPNNLLHSYFTPLDECIETAIKQTQPTSNIRRQQYLTNLLLDNTIPVTKNIKPLTFRNETYRDIQESPYLRGFFSYNNRGRSLNNLKGIKANEMRIFSPHDDKDEHNSPEISAVLQAAFDNFVLGISSDLNVDEITGDECSLALLKAKGQRVGMPIEGQKAFTQIQEISGIPDIGIAFADKLISAEQLLDLRESKHAGSLRDWFAKSTPEESHADITQRYVESLGKSSVIEYIPVKVMRFATTLGIGTIQPVAGAIASGVDSFLLGKWFPKKSPRLFLKHAKSVIIKSVEKITPPTKRPSLSGRDRNRACSCGSELKYKHCCGK
jgi:hypothetical protein